MMISHDVRLIMSGISKSESQASNVVYKRQIRAFRAGKAKFWAGLILGKGLNMVGTSLPFDMRGKNPTKPRW